MKSSLKQSKGPKIFRSKDIYVSYARKLLQENPDYVGFYNAANKLKNYRICQRSSGDLIEIITYPLFKRILEEYFTAAKEAIINGHEFNLKNNLGCIAARRVERNYANKSVNWVETNKQPKKENGKASKIIYHLDEDWCRIGWEKRTSFVALKDYKFVPAPSDGRGGGFVTEFSRALSHDPLLKFKYNYYAYIWPDRK